MQLRLIILRHAKSSWKSDASIDHERPLNKRGRRDAPRIAAHLVDLGWEPDHIISSDSTRTRETWARMEDCFGDVRPDFTYDLYHAGLDAIQEALMGLDDKVETAMVIGHNPGWEAAVHSLTGIATTMTTCNAALLSLSADSWQSAMTKTGDWTLEAVLRPKELN